MANDFTQNPVDRVLGEISRTNRQSLGALGALGGTGQPAAPAQPTTAREFFDSLSREAGVPANVIWALEEASAQGDIDPPAARERAKNLAQLRQASQGDIQKALAEALGDPERARMVLDRAYDIADEIYPTERQTERDDRRNSRSRLDDVALGLGGGVVTGTGRAISGLGNLMQMAPEAEDRSLNLLRLPPDLVGRGIEAVGSGVKAWGEMILDRRSDRALEAAEKPLFEGNVLDPRSWELAEGASFEGALQQAAVLFGELAPVVLSGGKGLPGLVRASAVGGFQGVDAGIDEGSAIIDEAIRDGTVVNLPYYQEQIAAGATPEQAVAATREAAGNIAGLVQGAIAGAGGAATSAIFHRGITNLASRSAIPRIGGTAAVGSLEEGSQEVAEGAFGRAAVNARIGTEEDVMAGTLNEFGMGAMAGGPLQAMGALQRREPMPDPNAPIPGQEAAAPPPGADPAAMPPDAAPMPPSGPMGALPAPPGPDVPPDSAPPLPEEANPDVPLDPLTGEVLPPAPDLPGTEAPPRTNIAGAEAAGGPTVEEAEAAAQVPQRFPDMKPGQRVTLRDVDGRDVPVTFLREDPEGVVLRMFGEEQVLSPREFDEAVAAFEQAQNEPAPAPVSQVSQESQESPVVDDDFDERAAIAEFDGGLTRAEAEAVARGETVSPVVEMEDPPWPDVPDAPTVDDAAAIEGERPRGEMPEAPEAPTSVEPQAEGVDQQPQGVSQDITRANGEPFLNQSAARRAARERGLADDSFTVEPMGGGFVARPMFQGDRPANDRPQVQAPPAPDAEAPALPPSALSAPAAERPPAPAPTAQPAPEAEAGAEPLDRVERAVRAGAVQGVREEVNGHRIVGADTRDGTGRIVVSRTSDRELVADIPANLPPEEIMARIRAAVEAEAGTEVAQQETETPTEEAAPDPSTIEGKLAAAREAGTTEHTTKKGKTLTGFILRGVTQNEAKSIDSGTFRKDGGFFVRAERADRSQTGARPEQIAVEEADNTVTFRHPATGSALVAFRFDDYRPGSIQADITEVPEGARRRGISQRLHDAAIDYAEGKGGRFLSGYEITDDGRAFYEGLRRKGYQVNLVDLDNGEQAYEVRKPGEATPTPEAVDAAAAETDPNPTPAQVEVEVEKPGASEEDIAQYIPNPGGSRSAGRGVTIERTPDGGIAILYYGFEVYRGTVPGNSLTRSRFMNSLKVAQEGGNELTAKIMPAFTREVRFQAANTTLPEGYKIGGMEQRVKLTDPDGKVRRDTLLVIEDARDGIAQEMAQMQRIAEAGARLAQQSAPVEPEVDTPAEEAAPEPEAPPTPTYGAQNKLVSADRAAELRARLKDKLRNQTSAGIDPEILAIGAELAVFHIEAGARRFIDLARTIASDLDTTPAALKPYLRSWYNGARDMMEDSDISVEGMDDADAVRTILRSGEIDDLAAGNPAEQALSDNPAAPEEAPDVRRDNEGAGRSEPDEGGADTAGVREPRGLRTGDRGPGDGGRAGAPGRSERAADGDGDRAAVRDRGSRRRLEPAADHVIEPGGLAPASGEKTRARQSIEAVRVLRTLQAEGRPATAEEKRKLALYGGAGTLAPALPNSEGRSRMPDILAEIEELFSPEERATLDRTTQYAFYTAEPVVRAMWSLANRLGFTGGRVFEPGMGVGGFIGTLPDNLRGDTRYHGVELDHVTADIAKALYPKSNISQGDFIKQPMPRDAFDLVIGNPPFARTAIKADPAYPQGFMLHDYFFAKSIDSVRPGGLLMFVTSAGTMNKLDRKARDYIADRADLLGAIRLPETAFQDFAGTSVTTDIVVLQKRAEGQAEANPMWRESTTISLPDKEGGMGEGAVNRYFQEKPQNILGEQGLFDKLIPNRVGVRATSDDLGGQLRQVMNTFPRDTMSDNPARGLDIDLDPSQIETKAGSFFIENGKLMQFTGQRNVEVGLRKQGEKGGVPKPAMDRIRALVPVKMALRKVYAADAKNEDAAAARAELNAAYDAFVSQFGPIGKKVFRESRPSRVEMEGLRQRAREAARNSGEPWDDGSFDAGPMLDQGMTMREIAAARAEAMKEPGYRDGSFNPDSVSDKVSESFPNIAPFRDDQESYRLLAIEHYDPSTDTATKGRAFTDNAIIISREPEINGPEDALTYVLGQTGRVDLDRIAKLTETSRDRVERELGDLIFQDPVTGAYETKAKYLSNNIYAKLDAVRTVVEQRPEFQKNMDALLQVIPDPIPAEEINATIGASWFDPDYYSQWAQSKGLALSLNYVPAVGAWTVEGTKQGSAATSDWGTEDMPFGKMMSALLNGKPIVVKTKPDEDSAPVVNPERTQEANDKALELRADFNEWLWSDPERASEMGDLYNRTFNADVAPSYTGDYLTTPGVSAEWGWRPHQRSVIARILQSGTTYMAHTVGAGKTSAMIGAAMEGRRLGLVKKPMFVVPNHMLQQFAKEFYEQYPLANIAVADEDKFHTSVRKTFIADMQVNDYDAIILTHSAFKLIPVSQAARTRVLGEMLADIREAVDTVGKGDRAMDQSLLGAVKAVAKNLGVDTAGIEKDEPQTRKKLEQMLEAAEQRMSADAQVRGQDAVSDFDELGVDQLFLDEAHMFRKLSFVTQKASVKGVDNEGSEKSMDMLVKTRLVEERNPGRGLVFASGTPITNTMGELYSISQFLQPQALAEKNINAFDAWANTFGVVTTALERQPQGGWKDVPRFAKFVNTPELSLMVRQVMDIVTSSDLDQYVTRPALKGGERQLVVVPPSNEVTAIQSSLAGRFEHMKTLKPEERKGDYHYFSIMMDGRQSAIDARLVDPDATGEGSKLNALVRNAYRVWKEGANAPLHGVKPEGGYTDAPAMTGPTSQIIFSTMGIGGTQKNPGFSTHRYIKAELVRMGVPASDIITQEELKSDILKQRATNDMNEGKRRILVAGEKFFTGVNAQKRLAAIHNLDPLWFPANDEQRNGRGIRQGNMNPEISIFDYSTQDTYDSTMWQLMGRKAAFIEGFYAGDPNMRDMEDLGEASTYEQAMAMSVSDPRIIELQELRGKKETLERRKKAAARRRSKMEADARIYARTAENNASWDAVLEQVAEATPSTKGDAFSMEIDGQTITERKDAGEALNARLQRMFDEGSEGMTRVGSIAGWDIYLQTRLSDMSGMWRVQAKGADVFDQGDWSDSAIGLVRKIESGPGAMAARVSNSKSNTAKYRRMAEDAREGLERVKGFTEQADLDAVTQQVDELETQLRKEADEESKAQDEGKARRRTISEGERRPMAKRIAKRLRDLGIEGGVSARIVMNLMDKTGAIEGRYSRGAISIAEDAPDQVAVFNHEVIHALRDADLWGRSHGLFTEGEWRALVRAARADSVLMARIRRDYPDYDAAAQIEEAVAEMYVRWARTREGSGMFAAAMERARTFFNALSRAFMGEGAVSVSEVFGAIERGEVGRRSNAPTTASANPDSRARRKSKNVDDPRRDWLDWLPRDRKGWRTDRKGFFSDLMTDAMGGKGGGANLLALVPGRPLFMELAKNLPAARAYVRIKEEMDTQRQEWQAKAATIADEWMQTARKGRKENEALMDIMHRATIAGVDPSQPMPNEPKLAQAQREMQRPGPVDSSVKQWAAGVIAGHEARSDAHAILRREFLKLPTDMQRIFRKVAKTYDQMGDEFEAGVLENIRNASRVALRKAERDYKREMQRIKDDGLTGQAREDAKDLAQKKVEAARKRAGWALNARIGKLRAEFESNRLKGPYFPLARFGDYFVTLRDEDGRVQSFSRFESRRAQRLFAEEMEAEGWDVGTGVLSAAEGLKDQVDPAFVADVQDLLGDMGTDPKIMDAVWQRWLETLPDKSIRKNRIHRKGRAGYDEDALRAFTSHMFHGAHQLARLTHGMDLEEALMKMEEQAEASGRPERDMLIVNEARRRHAFTMQPTGAAWSAWATSAAFVWYLGATPAAAVVNLSQTTVVGPAILGAKFRKQGMTGAISALGKAAKDYGKANFDFANSKTLTADEKAAIVEAQRRMVIQRTQAHDLAAIQETGIEYNPAREKVMRLISGMFHHAEVANRAVTFLAAYRMAKQDGMVQEDAIQKAADVTYEVHFSYQNTDRPRLMQNDYMKVLTIFRQFSVNMLFRMARDLHQWGQGETPEARREARDQFVGISLSMFAHAGFTGLWGYGILKMIMGMFFGGGDEFERKMYDFVLSEEDTMQAKAWNYGMGMLLKGVPGQVAGIEMSERIGMPNLWFRGTDRIMEGEDLYWYYVAEMLGPMASMGEGFARGASRIANAGGFWDVYRGVETGAPKAIRDLMQAARYASEGVETRNGDPILESVNLGHVLKEASGFMPADIAERYKQNSRMMNRQMRIQDERRGLQREMGDNIREGKPISDSLLEKVQRFNAEYPEYPITRDTLQRSVQSRNAASARNEFGIQLNPRLNQRIRGEEAPLLYN